MISLSKNTIISLVFISIMLLVMIAVLTFLSENSVVTTDSIGYSTIENGKQILTIRAVGDGYEPKTIHAKSGIPGTIKFPPTLTFGCQNSVVIPDLDASKVLSRSSDTEFEFAAQPAGKTIKGSCAMGMYDFEIIFN